MSTSGIGTCRSSLLSRRAPEVAVRRFALISEVEARQIEPGATVELERGGHVTPLARDTLAARRVTVVPAGSVDPALPADLAPRAAIARVAIGSDHTGTALKSALVAHLRKAGKAVNDLGTDGPDPVDYPDIAAAVGRAVARGEADAGIVIDGAGLGSTIAANKIRGVRAAMCPTPTLARYAREHNGANVLALGATLVTTAEAVEIVETWMSTSTREPRYLRRLLKIRRLEDAF
jgi:ribose 5-phosphate isomerase B